MAVYLLAAVYCRCIDAKRMGLVIAAITGAVLVLLLVLAVSLHVRQAVSLLIIGIMFGQIAARWLLFCKTAATPTR